MIIRIEKLTISLLTRREKKQMIKKEMDNGIELLKLIIVIN